MNRVSAWLVAAALVVQTGGPVAAQQAALTGAPQGQAQPRQVQSGIQSTKQDIPAGASVDLAPGMVMQNIAAESGGMSSITKHPREALAAIDEVTRFEYLLG